MSLIFVQRRRSNALIMAFHPLLDWMRQLFIAVPFLYLWQGPYNHLSNNEAYVASVAEWEQKIAPSREVVSRPPHHPPASLIFLLLLQLSVARMWKEPSIANGTLATQASNNEITIHTILWYFWCSRTTQGAVYPECYCLSLCKLHIKNN